MAVTVTTSDLGNVGSGGAQTASGTITLAVTPTPDAPVAVGTIPNQAALVGQAFTFTLPGGAFADPDTGEVLTLSARLASGAALPAWLVFNPATGVFTGTPPADAAPTATDLDIRITATDPTGRTAAQTFRLTISPDNGAGDVSFRIGEPTPLPPQDPTPPGSSFIPSETILSGGAIRDIFTGPGTRSTLLARIFAGQNDLDNPDSTEPPLLGSSFAPSGWFVAALDSALPPLAETGAAGHESVADLGVQREADPLGMGRGFSRQVADATDAFDRRTALLDRALAAAPTP